MKKTKTILFIGNNYCSIIEDLRSTFESNNKSNYVGKEGKPLRKELLAYFKDGLLSNWLVEHGYSKTAKQLPTWKPSDDISDNELFKAIYKVIFERECTADLESAFSSIAELVYCEVDGTEAPIKNNKIELSEKANEIKFVYKALEEIDSKVCFELTKLKSKPKHWAVNSKKDSYSKGEEFSIFFNFQGKEREGLYVWNFISDHKERLYEMEIYGIQRHISLNNGELLTLYRFDDEMHEFWVTRPKFLSVSSDKALEHLNKKDESFKFRWATIQEIETILKQGTELFDSVSFDKAIAFRYYEYYEYYEYRRYDKGRYISIKPKDSEKYFTDYCKDFCFVVVLDETAKK